MAFVGKFLKPLRGALQLNQMKLYNLHKKQNLPITADEAWDIEAEAQAKEDAYRLMCEIG